MSQLSPKSKYSKDWNITLY